MTNSSPVRISVPGVTANPQSTPVFEAGAGVTPIIGLRLGVSFARGAYLTKSEFVAPLPQDDRRVTLAGFEAEYAFRYTKLTGEVVHDTFATIASGDVGATSGSFKGRRRSHRAGPSPAVTKGRRRQSSQRGRSSAHNRRCFPTS